MASRSRSNVCTTSAFSSSAVDVALNEECHSKRLTNKQIGLIRVKCRKQIPTYDTNRAGVTNCGERANPSAS